MGQTRPITKTTSDWTVHFNDNCDGCSSLNLGGVNMGGLVTRSKALNSRASSLPRDVKDVAIEECKEDTTTEAMVTSHETLKQGE